MSTVTRILIVLAAAVVVLAAFRYYLQFLGTTVGSWKYCLVIGVACPPRLEFNGAEEIDLAIIKLRHYGNRGIELFALQRAWTADRDLSASTAAPSATNINDGQGSLVNAGLGQGPLALRCDVRQQDPFAKRDVRLGSWLCRNAEARGARRTILFQIANDVANVPKKAGIRLGQEKGIVEDGTEDSRHTPVK